MSSTSVPVLLMPGKKRSAVIFHRFFSLVTLCNIFFFSKNISGTAVDDANFSPVDVVQTAVVMLLSQQIHAHASRQLDGSVSSAQAITTTVPATTESSSSSSNETTTIPYSQGLVVTSLVPITHELTLLVAGTSRYQ